MCSKGQRDAYLSIRKVEATMEYSFLSIQFLLLQCIQGVPYIALQRGNGRVKFERSQGIWKAKSQGIQNHMRKTPKVFGHMHTS